MLYRQDHRLMIYGGVHMSLSNWTAVINVISNFKFLYSMNSDVLLTVHNL